MKLLSILVPTFNRDNYLDRLLAELSRQIRESNASEIVEVIISDNASSDNTKSIVDSHLSNNSSFSGIRHSSNIGAESNLISLLDRASSKFFWFIGDDDFPVAGLIRHVIIQLNAVSPSLLYLPSVWATNISTIDLDQSKELSFVPNKPLKAAKDLHIWTTFISSWIFNADLAFSSPSALQKILSLKGSNLPQLGWILPLLVQSQSIILVASRPCILATSGNSGGYSVLSTFLIGYPTIVNSYTTNSPLIRSALVVNALKTYLPYLIVSLRRGRGSRNAGDSEGIFFVSLKLLWFYPYFWLFCVPAFFVPLGILRAIAVVFKKLNLLVKHLWLLRRLPNPRRGI
jgi:glycosyltransferase involved in cell wall biosynthesis